LLVCLTVAFAELQTEVSDFTSDLNVIGIPFWDYKTFSHNILFPAHPDYSVLRCDMKVGKWTVVTLHQDKSWQKVSSLVIAKPQFFQNLYLARHKLPCAG